MNASNAFRFAIVATTAAATIPDALAHCPLCTVGALMVTGGALWLGVSPPVVALLVGAFAVSMGWMIGRKLKQYIRHQPQWFALISFLTTIIPIIPYLRTGTPADYYAFYLSLAGGYGTLLNRTYLIDVSLVTSIVGGLIVAASPSVSKRITALRQTSVPYQGVGLTLILLIIASIATQFLLG